MYEIFEQLLQEHNLTAYQFCKESGVPQSTISAWKKNNSSLSPKYQSVVANYFGVTIDYLMGNNTENASNTISAKDNNERELLLLCRKIEGISEDDKNDFVDFLKHNMDFYMKAKGLK